jgi:superoxide reductase
MATKVGQIYKCELCGNVVSVLEQAEGELVCCGQPMKLLEEKYTETEGNEKHVPVIHIEGNKVTVKVGDVPHPMEQDHWIELIQLLDSTGNIVMGKRLKPGETPEAVFHVENTQGLKARELCNKHGLWRSA